VTIFFEPMTEAEFEIYMARMVPDYAREHVGAGSMSEEDALRLAEEQVRELLPEGVATKDQYIYSVRDKAESEAVGVLWFARQERGAQTTAFVYDIQIFEPFRRRGYASQAFRLLEDRARELKISAISLHVFGHNHGARKMYTGLGYEETHVMRSKSLGTEEGRT